jgi:hypothetical protein
VGYFVNGRQVGWVTKDSLDLGEISDNFGMVQRWRVPSAGSYQIKAIVDDVNRFTELNENNNSLEKELSVAPAGQPVPPAQKDELIQQLQLQIQELMKQLIGLMSQLVELLQKQLKSQ